MSINILPRDVLIDVFLNLTLQEMSIAAQVCRLFRQIALADETWRLVAKRLGCFFIANQNLNYRDQIKSTLLSKKASGIISVWKALANAIHQSVDLPNHFDSPDQAIETAKQFNAWFNKYQTALVHLRGLDLSGYQLHCLPPEIGKLSLLETLDLSDNQLSYLPSMITTFYALKQLILSRNQLSYLPSSIQGLKKLEVLDLSCNLLTELPNAISQLENLAKLDLSGNHLKELPQSFLNLIRLQRLILCNNPFHNPSEIKERIKKLPILDQISKRLLNS